MSSALAGALAYVLLLWLHGPWEEVLAAILIGSVAGIVDRSPCQMFLGAAACASGRVAASVLFSTWTVDARSLLTRAGPSFRPEESEIAAAHRIVVSGDMAAADSYCGRLMEELGPTFRCSRRLLRQLDYARLLGLGQPDPGDIEVIEVPHP